MLGNLFRDLIGLLFPDLCAACGVHLYRGERFICTKCRHDLPYSDHHLHADNAAAKKFWGRLELKAVFALLYFRKGSRVQNILHSLKYKNQPQLGIELGRMVAEKLLLSKAYLNIDLIVPVPLHRKREKMRGYNQSLMIAKGISEKLGLPVEEKNLQRRVATESQTRKGRFSRHENIAGVFELKDAAALTGRHILLVDDVITTGATLEACANELLKHGITKISIAALAFAD
jgi:ComF family protein